MMNVSQERYKMVAQSKDEVKPDSITNKKTRCQRILIPLIE